MHGVKSSYGLQLDDHKAAHDERKGPLYEAGVRVPFIVAQGKHLDGTGFSATGRARSRPSRSPPTPAAR